VETATRSVTATVTAELNVPPVTCAVMLWFPGAVAALAEYVAVVSLALVSVPTEALPFSTPSTNH